MKRILTLILVLAVGLAVAGCRSDAPGGEIEISREVDLFGATQIKLVNAHNGYSTTITDETAIANITAFVGGTCGKPMGSGKGYFEGTYSVVFSYESGEEFLITYGDENVFYMGQGEDGYPIRYRLTNITISDDVLPSLSLYDDSGMVWENTK